MRQTRGIAASLLVVVPAVLMVTVGEGMVRSHRCLGSWNPMGSSLRFDLAAVTVTDSQGDRASNPDGA